MKITSLHVEGFRSLANVTLKGLGPFVVLYGVNGAGKSNVLGAIEAACDGHSPTRLRRDSRTVGVDAVVIDLRIERQREGTSPFRLKVESTDAVARREPLHLSSSDRRWLAYPEGEMALESAFHAVDAARSPRVERRGSGTVEDVESYVQQRLRDGGLAAALLAARNSPSFDMRKRYKQLQQMLQGAPLHRPPFVPVEYPDGRIELREELPDGSGDIPLNLAGLGVFQLYAILAQIVLSGARIIALEEPEAHLHAPTSGRHLRTLLKRCVDEGLVDQFFIATHSNLFDLDPEGYWDVSLDSQGHTQVERRPLTDIDARHLYEPGPAKHALLRLLEYIDPESVVFRDAEGSGISAKRMVQMLQSDDKLALDFLRDVNGAAVQSVRARARRQPVS